MINKSAESALWSIASNWKLPSRHTSSAISQIAVIAELARQNPGLRKVVLEEGDAYLKDTLMAAQSVLETLGVQNDKAIINTEDTCWAHLSRAEVSDNLKLLLDNPAEDLLAYAQQLQSVCLKNQRGGLGVPPELIQLMYSQVADADNLSFPTDESALAAIYVVQENQRQYVSILTTQIFELVCRCHFIAKSSADIRIANFFEPRELPENTATFLIPIFGAKLRSHEKKLLTDDIKWRNTVASEEGQVRHSLNVDFGTHVVLVPSGFLFRGGSCQEVRRFLFDRAGLHTVIDIPPRVLEATGIGCAILATQPGAGCARVRIVSCDDESLVVNGPRGRAELKGWQELAHLLDTKTEHELVTDVNVEQLIENDWALQFARYKQTGESIESLFGDMATVALSGVAEIYRPLVIKKDAESDGISYKEVLISDFEASGPHQSHQGKGYSLAIF